MQFASVAKASVLALAIAAVSAAGFSAVRSGLDVYQKSVEFSQAQWDKNITMKPDHVTPDDQLLSAAKFIYAWALGKDSLFYRLDPGQTSPLDALLAASDACARVPSHYQDDQAATLVIRVPEAPWEARLLVETVRRHAIAYTIDAGSDFIEIPFIFMGQSSP